MCKFRCFEQPYVSGRLCRFGYSVLELDADLPPLQHSLFALRIRITSFMFISRLKCCGVTARCIKYRFHATVAAFHLPGLLTGYVGSLQLGMLSKIQQRKRDISVLGVEVVNQQLVLRLFSHQRFLHIWLGSWVGTPDMLLVKNRL